MADRPPGALAVSDLRRVIFDDLRVCPRICVHRAGIAECVYVLTIPTCRAGLWMVDVTVPGITEREWAMGVTSPRYLRTVPMADLGIPDDSNGEPGWDLAHYCTLA